jgi:small subunit ribosomal protein S13
MARIAGINVPLHKHVIIGLTAIFGVGVSTARKICQRVGVDCTKKVKNLDDSELCY